MYMKFNIKQLLDKNANIIHFLKKNIVFTVLILYFYYYINNNIHFSFQIENLYLLEMFLLFIFYNLIFKVKICIIVIICILLLLLITNNKYEDLKIMLFGDDENSDLVKQQNVSLNKLVNIININNNEMEHIIDDDSLTVYSKTPVNYAFYDLPKVNISVNTLYSAIIIEPRKHLAMEFVLKNFLENLSEEWTIIIIHGNTNKQFIYNIINKKLFLYKHRIQTIDLNVDNLTISQYSELFFNYKFYDYIPTETFLIFQTDSMILEENRNKIYDYIEYDYVGAPWVESLYGPIGIGNGGLSLRKKSKMIKLLKYRNIASIRKLNTYYGEYLPEDRFFNGDYTMEYVNINKPTLQKSMCFSVEAIYNTSPFGIHKCWGHLSQQNLNKLTSLYPKIKILMNYNK